VFIKAPADVLDFEWDWSVWMAAGDAISTASWIIPETFLTPPTNLIESPSANGGTFAAGAYYWVVTARNAAGETTPSNEVTATLTGSTSSVTLGWNQVTGATGYNVYRGSNATGTPVTHDASGSGTIGTNVTGPTGSLTATCSYTRGSSANYVVAAVSFFAGLEPSVMTCTYGGSPMSLLGSAVSGYGGIAFFGLSGPPSGAQTVSANVQSVGSVTGMAVTCASFIGWGSTVFTPAPLDYTGGNQGGNASNPTQTVSAVYGDLVVWGVTNIAGLGINTALSSFNQTSLENSGEVNLPLSDALTLLLGYAAGPSSGPSSVSFTANAAQVNIDQWWSAATLTLLPAAPPINTLVTTISNPVTTIYTDTGSAGTTSSPPASSTAFTSISQASSPAPSTTATSATVWIANGTSGEQTPVTCRITTTAGRVAQNTQQVSVIDL
jgi:hypothetical protein